jgi:hypothetical protein
MLVLLVLRCVVPQEREEQVLSALPFTEDVA